ncbi:hypothetical protein [Microcoleus sp. B9-D4]|uniref:hypothetical protein n=1 Tax=Microcoleus sp. B9-D4 TaxID=2818711 RepID=UPI002FD171AA
MHQKIRRATFQDLRNWHTVMSTIARSNRPLVECDRHGRESSQAFGNRSCNKIYPTFRTPKGQRTRIEGVKVNYPR